MAESAPRRPLDPNSAKFKLGKIADDAYASAAAAKDAATARIAIVAFIFTIPFLHCCIWLSEFLATPSCLIRCR